jgi:hypothetical protein
MNALLRNDMSADAFLARDNIVAASKFALVPHRPQIMRVMWTAAWRRDIRKRIFQDPLFPIQTVGTQNVSLLKPVSFVLWPAGRNHRLSNLFFITDPAAQFLRSVSPNSFDLIFDTVIVLHSVSPFLANRQKFNTSTTCVAVRPLLQVLRNLRNVSQQ